MPLSIADFAEPLFSVDRRGARSAGIFHRLTGRAYGLDAAADSLLRLMRDEPIELEDVDASGPRDLILRLERDGLVTAGSGSGESSAAGVPRGLCDFRLHHPLRNAAVAVADGAGHGRIIHTSDLATCRLPRTAWRPQILIDVLDDCAIALLDMASAGEPWRTVEATLLGRGFTAGAVGRALRFLTDPERQLLRLIAPDADAEDPDEFFQLPCQNFEAAAAPVTPASSHYEKLDCAQQNFDWLETTVSHAFRAPTAALRGYSFGGCIANHYLGWLKARAATAPVRILEIGGGLGHFAQAFVQRVSEACGACSVASYTILDRSPALRSAQRALVGSDPRFEFVAGDAQESLAGGRYDLILANEVIADFEVAEHAGGAVLQIGAERFLSLLPPALRPGGKAYVSEYGHETAQPELVAHLDHAEYSVEFKSLRAATERSGLTASLTPLSRLLRPAARAELLIGQQERYLCLDALLRGRGESLEFRAYDRDEFEQRFLDRLRPSRILSPLFAPQHRELHYGPAISQFIALELTAPAAATASRKQEAAVTAPSPSAR